MPDSEPPPTTVDEHARVLVSDADRDDYRRRASGRRAASARRRTMGAASASLRGVIQERPVASRSRSYRLASGNGGNQDSRRTIQLS